MKKIMIVAAMMLLGAWNANVNAQNVNENEVMFNVEANRLSSYLNLNKYQAKDVEKINKVFVEAQKSSADETAMETAIKKNLFLMSRTLDYGQYRKYRALLNVTVNNKKTVIGNTNDYIAQR